MIADNSKEKRELYEERVKTQ